MLSRSFIIAKFCFLLNDGNTLSNLVGGGDIFSKLLCTSTLKENFFFLLAICAAKDEKLFSFFNCKLPKGDGKELLLLNKRANLLGPKPFELELLANTEANLFGLIFGLKNASNIGILFNFSPFELKKFFKFVELLDKATAKFQLSIY